MTHIGSTLPVHIRTHGAVPPEATDYAVTKLGSALQHAPDPVVASWVTLDAAAPGDRVDAHVNISGIHVHVHAVGETLQEATDLMQERLRSRLRRIRRRYGHGTSVVSF
jgi:ribosome-associated translation inhibitor RaiA